MRGLPVLGWWPFMADEASDTLGGGTKNFLGAVAFTMVLVGGEELGRKLLTGSSTAPGWLSAIVCLAAFPLFVAPAIWKAIQGAKKDDTAGVPDLRVAHLSGLSTPPAPPLTGMAAILERRAQELRDGTRKPAGVALYNVRGMTVDGTTVIGMAHGVKAENTVDTTIRNTKLIVPKEPPDGD